MYHAFLIKIETFLINFNKLKTLNRLIKLYEKIILLEYNYRFNIIIQNYNIDLVNFSFKIIISRVYQTLRSIETLIYNGYYSDALSLVRKLEEFQILLKYLKMKPQLVKDYLDSNFELNYGNACDELGIDKANRKTHYKLLSDHVHTNVTGGIGVFYITRKEKNKIGFGFYPQYREDFFKTTYYLTVTSGIRIIKEFLLKVNFSEHVKDVRNKTKFLRELKKINREVEFFDYYLENKIEEINFKKIKFELKRLD